MKQNYPMIDQITIKLPLVTKQALEARARSEGKPLAVFMRNEISRLVGGMQREAA